MIKYKLQCKKCTKSFDIGLARQKNLKELKS